MVRDCLNPRGAVVSDRDTPHRRPEGYEAVVLRTLGTTLRHYRKQQGLSQQALATKAGLHYTYVSEIELGQRNVSVLSLLRLATALHLPLSALLLPLEAHQDTSTGAQE
jgi:DNA-binding XRE family transcriptional regulator